MSRTLIERRKIHRRAKKILGQRQYDPQDRYTYIQQCVEDMMQSGETDDALEAQNICELLWMEDQDLGEYD